MKCYIHAGIPKTGTSTIKNFLTLNKNNLFKSGYTVLVSNLDSASYGFEHLSNYAHIGIGVCDSDVFNTRIQPAYGWKIIDSEKRFNNFQQDLYADISKQIKDSRSENFIISSDFHWLKTDADVDRLKSYLLSLGFDDFKVFIYLRNYDEYMNSYIQETLKIGVLEEVFGGDFHINSFKVRDNRSQIFDILKDYKLKLEPWIHSFGINSIKPRIFKDNFFFGNSLIKDLKYVLDISSEDCIEPTSKNQSISFKAAKFLEGFQDKLKEFRQQGFNINFISLIISSLNIMSGDKFNTNIIYDDLLYQKLVDSDKWFKDNFPDYQNKDCFFDQVDSKNSVIDSPDNNLKEEQTELLVEVFSEIFNDKQYYCHEAFYGKLFFGLQKYKSTKRYIVLYGYGSVGKLIFPHLQQSLLGVVDLDLTLDEIEGIPVLTVDDVKNMYFQYTDLIVLVSRLLHIEEIKSLFKDSDIKVIPLV
ncbi:MAG: hypothetical protein MK033_03615 [Candidatus Caenarcaniphilales bacterium]|nr:hypothetical protein [Candidatus Caenarcaniphilales bacterium]